MILINEGISEKLLDTVATGVQNSDAFSMPTRATQSTWQTSFTSAPASISILLQVSLDNSNWVTVDSSSSTTGDSKTFNSSALFVRARIDSASGGSGITVSIVCKSGILGTTTGSGIPAPPLNSVQFNNAGLFGGDTNFTWDTDQPVPRLSLPAGFTRFGPDTYGSGPTNFGGGGYSEAYILATVDQIHYGHYVETHIGDIASGAAYGISSTVTTQSGATKDIALVNTGFFDAKSILPIGRTANIVSGIQAYGSNLGAGTVSELNGGLFQIDNNGGGTVTLGRGLFVAFESGRTWNNVYGIGIEDMSGLTASIKQAINYADKFIVDSAGNIVSIVDIKAATYHVGAAPGIDASITTAGLVGKTITVSKGIITGFA